MGNNAIEKVTVSEAQAKALRDQAAAESKQKLVAAQRAAQQELEQARTFIHKLLGEITPLEKNPEASAKKNLLLKLAQSNFEGVCKVLNFLIDIHVLA